MTDANTTVVSAVSATRSGSVSVRATEHGVPIAIAIAIDERELRYGGTALASTILDRCTRATAAARAQRRIRLAEDGVPADILDRLGLPTDARVAADANDDLAQEPAPTSWLRPV
jgi:hypothetical protein